MMNEIDTILDAYNANTLREMAEAAGLIGKKGKKPQKAELSALLRQQYFTEERVQASLGQLNERERAVLNRLLLRGGQTPSRSFQRELLRARLVTSAPEPEKSKTPYYYYHSDVPYANGYAGSPHRTDSQIFEDVIARLTYLGLVFSQYPSLNSAGNAFKLQFHPASTLYIPRTIRRYLPEPEPLPLNTEDWQPARVQHGESTLLLRDLYLYWDFLRRNEVTLNQNGSVGKRWLKAINDILLVSDPALEAARREEDTTRLLLLRQLLEALKLVHVDKDALRPTSRNALEIDKFWSWSHLEQVSACLEAWPKLSSLKELSNDTSTYQPRYNQARQFVLDELKTAPAHTWLELDEFLEQLRNKNPDFLFYERSKVETYRGSWYYSSYGGNYYGEPKQVVKKFDDLEERFVNGVLSGFLYQLGLIEFGFNQAEPLATGQVDTWRAFRLTPTGRTLLNESNPSPSDTETGRIVVQPNFQVMAIGPVSLAALAQLDLFADREQADRGAFQYRLSRESIYRAQQLGLAVDQVIEFLTKTSAVELPQNVRRSLDEWAAHHERIVFRTGVSLLQVASPNLLADLMEQPPSGRYLARSLTPEIALIKKGQQARLVSGLIHQNIFPAVSGARPEAADNSVIVGADGTIRPIHAVPSLHLWGRLTKLAEELPDGMWQLTPASIRRVGGSRNKVLALLEELRKLSRGMLPEGLLDQIKAWGGYYGDAAVETLTLIEFRDQTTLAELLDRSDIQTYLTPFPAGNRALALVSTDKLADLKETLARLGVQVKEGL